LASKIDVRVSSWISKYNTININGELFSLDDIENCQKYFDNPFERKIFDFLSEWYSTSSTIIQKTSGTTGDPKELRISKQLLIQSALNTGKYLELKENDKIFLCLPVDYIAGKMMIVRAIVLNLQLHFQLPSSNPEIEQDYDFSAFTPMQLENIIKQDKKSIDRIKKIIIGGAPVSFGLIENLQEIKSECYETFGMSETGSHIALKKLNNDGKSEFFEVLEGIEISANEDNQLIISSEKMKINNLVTNDIIKIFDPNRFLWLGRMDNLINSGGLKISPEYIENKLRPFLKNKFFIFGNKDEVFNELPAILIEGEKSGNLIEIFQRELSKFEIPKHVYYLKNFVYTESGKVNRKETIELLEQ
jgi:O-succinylbenzoic acid--CoA ligase